MEKPVSNALVVLFDEQSNIIAETFSKFDGRFKLEGPCQDGYYNVVASKGDFGRGEIALENLKNEDATSMEIILGTDLEKPVLGTEMISYLGLEPILFDLNTDTVRSDDFATLDQVIEFMKWYPDLKVQVQSHTDAKSSKSYNLRLSKKRAKNTVAYFLAHGIESSRISGRGFGENQLINHCTESASCIEARHQENRRSEFIVVE